MNNRQQYQELAAAQRLHVAQVMEQHMREQFLRKIETIALTLENKAARLRQLAGSDDLESVALNVAHEVLWMVPNLSLEYLPGAARVVMEAKERLQVLEAAATEEAQVLAMVAELEG